MRTLYLLLMTLVSAVLYGCCFPPLRWYVLAWIAQVPFLIAVRRSRLGMALLWAWVFTVAVAYTTGDWFPRAVSAYYQQSALVGIAFFLGVSSLMGAPYAMAFAAVYRRLGAVTSGLTPLLAGAAWVSQEICRTRLFTGNPWATFGYSQVPSPLVMQVVDITGIYGVSFALVCVNAAIAEVLLQWRGNGATRRRARRGVISATSVAVVVLIYGMVRLHSPALACSMSRAVPVTIIQGNVDLGSQWRANFYGRNLAVYLQLTHAALTNQASELVLWPESTMTFFLDQEPTYRAAIGRVLTAHGAQLLTGGPRAVGTEPQRYFNSTFLLDPSGEIVAQYDKQHLLPFAEYFPIRSLNFLRREFGRVREFTPGEPTRPLPTVAGRAGVVICNEAMFPEPAAARVAEGAEFLVNPSNDSWVADRKFSEQQFDISAVRAIEQRRYLVRTSTSGPSAVVDPFGHVQVRTQPLTAATISGSIRACTTPTVYGRVGDLFAAGCLVATALACGRRHFSKPEKHS